MHRCRQVHAPETASAVALSAADDALPNGLTTTPISLEQEATLRECTYSLRKALEVYKSIGKNVEDEKHHLMAAELQQDKLAEKVKARSEKQARFLALKRELENEMYASDDDIE